MKKIIRHIKAGESMGRIVMGESTARDRETVERQWPQGDVSKEHIVRDFSNEDYVSAKINFLRDIDVDSAWARFFARISSGRLRRHRPAYRAMVISAASVAAVALIVLLARGLTGFISDDSQPVFGEEAHQVLMQFTPGKASAHLQINARVTPVQGEEVVTPAFVEVDSETFRYFSDMVQSNEQTNVVSVPVGSEFNFALPDGSHVWLNSGSEIEYFASGKTEARDIYLRKGEAYFSVAPDPSRPFRVHCSGHVVEALGTEFNVSAYEDSPFIYTTLVEGRVKLTVGNEGQTEEIMDRAGRQSMINRSNNALSMRDVDVRTYAGWKDGYFVFNQSSLFEVMENLSRWYGFKFDITDPALFNYHFTGEFNRFDDLEQVLEVIRSTGIPFSISSYEGKVLVFTKSK